MKICLGFDVLEDRCLLSNVNFVEGTLVIYGDLKDEIIKVVERGREKLCVKVKGEQGFCLDKTIVDYILVDSGSGNDRIVLNTNISATAHGGNGNDTITGGRGDDYLGGGDGADHINGGGGNDYIDGGQGMDILNGGIGDDFLMDFSCPNKVNGGRGYDTFYGYNPATCLNHKQVEKVIDFSSS